jgi:hypothetical protein
MQNIATIAHMPPLRPKLHPLFGFSHGWQIQMYPSSLVKQMSDEVIDMQALHDDHDCIVSLIVQPRKQCIAMPLY